MEQQSFHPPALPDVGASYPDRVLLSVRAYIADRSNETTASSSTSEGHRVQVTFFAATPPALSYLCVHCPNAAFSSEPRVIASQGNLILLSTAICSSSDPEEICCDYFVYSADGTCGSSLDLLPEPGHSITRANVGLVASGSCSGGYAVVTLNPDSSAKRYILRVHHEKTRRWRRKIVSRKMFPTESAGGKGLEDEVLAFESNKVIALQGSNIAWVDLRRAVLLCDVLDKDPVAYYIPLPEPLNDRTKAYLESFGGPCFYRDTVGRQNSIKFVEMEYRLGADSALVEWKAVTYSWAICSKNWRTDSVVGIEDVLKDSGGMLSLLRMNMNKGVELENIAPLYYPTLCDHDDILYLRSKPNHRVPKGSVVVVDASKKTMKAVIPVSDDRVTRYGLAFVHCTFSKCFSDVGDGWPKMEDQTSNVFLNLYIGGENLSNTRAAGDRKKKTATVYKSEKRKSMEEEEYKILGNSGDQWSDLLGWSMSACSLKALIR